MTKFFCVFASNRVIGDYECLGVYSIKEEAETFALTITDREANVLTKTWAELALCLYHYAKRNLLGPAEPFANLSRNGVSKAGGPTTHTLYGDYANKVQIVRGVMPK